jgi:hypothetical protein
MSYQLVAGELCLDFINTLDNRPRLELVIELLGTYEDLLQWSVEAGALPSSLARLAFGSAEEPVSATRQKATRLQMSLPHLPRLALPQQIWPPSTLSASQHKLIFNSLRATTAFVSNGVTNPYGLTLRSGGLRVPPRTCSRQQICSWFGNAKTILVAGSS